MRDQPRSKENDELRALAGGQLLTFGWREGMPVEEAKIYVEEALGYARAAGNRRHEAMLIAGYGRISRQAVRQTSISGWFAKRSECWMRRSTRRRRCC